MTPMMRWLYQSLSAVFKYLLKDLLTAIIYIKDSAFIAQFNVIIPRT
jgi:hypothetical protein